MKTHMILKGLTIGWLSLGLSLPVLGVEPSPGSEKDTSQQKTAPVVATKGEKERERPLVRVSDEKTVAPQKEERLYRPPSRGAPGGRVGGGTRVPSEDLPLLYALAPADHVGLSTAEQPVFVWYMSKATSHPLEFTVSDEAGVAPLIERRLAAPARQGINIIQSDQYGLALEPGKTYQWYVSLISDPDRRSKDVIAGGRVKMSAAPSSLKDEVKNANPVEATTLWAQAGFWYDAMGVISTNIQANPTDQAMRAVRASLLYQVDLETVAQVDRQQGL